MGAGTNKKMSRDFKAKFFKTLFLASVFTVVAWAYRAAQPPAPKKCGSIGGPPVTALRIRLKDGRIRCPQRQRKAQDHICPWFRFLQDIVESRGVYIVSFDRPGYGESDPNPKQTVKSIAFDIEELADQLGLGPRFYIVGFSLGGQIVWTCLKYIPHRLLGASLIAPVVNYWWPDIPSNASQEAYKQQLPQDQLALRVAHYAPWLNYWWNTQNLFSGLSLISNNPKVLSPQDVELIPRFVPIREEYQAQVRQQGEFESIHCDLKIGFGNWEFGPSDLENPFQENKGSSSVHLWQGEEDKFVPVTLQRLIAYKLPWIHYHELTGAGHMFPFADGISDSIIQTLLEGNKGI